MNMKQLGLPALFGLVLAGCVAPSGVGYTETTSYTCDHKYRSDPFTLDVNPTGTNPETIDVVADGDSAVSFTRIESASGVKYINNDQSIVFWSKGSEGFFIDPSENDEQYIDCTQI